LAWNLTSACAVNIEVFPKFSEHFLDTGEISVEGQLVVSNDAYNLPQHACGLLERPTRGLWTHNASTGWSWYWLGSCYINLHSVSWMIAALQTGYTSTGKILKLAFIGDSQMRHTYRQAVDILTGGLFEPYASRDFCKKKSKPTDIDTIEMEAGQFIVYGTGCWSGGARYQNTWLIADYFDSHNLLARSFVQSQRFMTTSYDAVSVAYGLHDINRDLSTIESDIKAAVKNIREWYPVPMKIVWEGLWQQNSRRKPKAWKLTGSTSRALCYMREVDRALNDPFGVSSITFIDTYAMSLAMLDHSKDGVHFSTEVMHSISILVLHDMVIARSHSIETKKAITGKEPASVT
jgi:hypothetical protein